MKRIAEIILAHKLNDWGYCSCGARPDEEPIWTDETHAIHQAEVISMIL